MFARDGWECKIFAWRDQIPGFSSVSCSDKPILQLSFGGLKLAVWPESFFFALRWFIRYIWDMHIILPVFKAFLSRVYWEHSISRNIDIFGPEATKKLVLFCWNFHPFSKNLFFSFVETWLNISSTVWCEKVVYLAGSLLIAVSFSSQSSSFLSVLIGCITAW